MSEKKDFEKEIRQKIADNKEKSKWLDSVDPLNEQKWTLKSLLLKMTFVRNVEKQDRKSNMISMIVLGAMYVIGILIIILDPSEKIFGFAIAGAASAWKFWTWGDDVDKTIDSTSNSYTARTNMFGEVKIEKDQSYVGCITAIIGLVLGIVVTPILFVRALLKFLNSDKTYKFAEEVVGELEDNLKIRYTYDSKKNKWNESVL